MLGGDNAEIILKNHRSTQNSTVIEQGRTADNWKAWVLGVYDADFEIRVFKNGSRANYSVLPSLASASRAGSSGWLYGLVSSGGDSLVVDLQAVHGDYRFVCSAELGDGAVDYSIISDQAFPEAVSYTHLTLPTN